jgi:electron transfer flavoprotein alpha subunit
MSNILVVIEHDGHAAKKVALSAVAFARQLAGKRGCGVELAILGAGAGKVADGLKDFGAACIHVADDAALSHPVAAVWGKAIADLAKAQGSVAVVAAASTLGKDVLPRVAVRLQAGMASDVVALADFGGNVAYRRTMWAGNLMGDVVVETAVTVVSVRASAFDAAAATGGASEVKTFAPNADVGRAAAKFVRFEGTVSSRPDLAEATVVVAGGRGLKPERGGFKLLEPLADVLGAAIGASRAAVDDGYAPNDYQVGQTGKIVAPQLYFAIAISGAVQHLAGMKNSKVIVAINTRDDEPIFKVADYGLVGDAFVVVPELASKIKALRS